MKYMKLTDEQKERHPSIHYTGSVRGMKKLGYWGKHDVCVRCGQYIYNISIWLDPNRSNKTERPKEELPQAYLDARLVCRPDSDWLRVDTVGRPEELDD